MNVAVAIKLFLKIFYPTLHHPTTTIIKYMAKQIIFDEKARLALKRGADQLANAVKSLRP